MNDPLKDTIEKSRQHLADLIDKIEDGFESVADESAELWDDAKPRLRAMKASIVAAEEALQTKTEEARLQAHLAVMDAHDQWSHLSQPVIELARHARNKVNQNWSTPNCALTWRKWMPGISSMKRASRSAGNSGRRGERGADQPESGRRTWQELGRCRQRLDGYTLSQSA